MQTEILRVLMSRDGRDAKHAAMHGVPGTILAVPRVGDEVRVFLDDGNWICTSPVKDVTRTSSEIVVKTANSTYRMKIRERAQG